MMMRRFLSGLSFAVALLCAPIWVDPAYAGRRVALVVGNSFYHHAPFLPNPANDAQAIAKMFRQAGFDVVTALNDLGNVDFKRTIRLFRSSAAGSDIAVVYYAGHGIEIHGVNYLIPVDAKLAGDDDAEDEAIKLEKVIDAVEGAKELRLIILDACRDNPFAQRQRTAATRGIVNAGLGLVQPSTINTMIAYAAKGGASADDGNADHSPFTAALLNNLFVPGRDIRFAFGFVRDEVLQKTDSRQEPFVYGSLGGGMVALVPPIQVERDAGRQTQEEKTEDAARAKQEAEIAARQKAEQQQAQREAEERRIAEDARAKEEEERRKKTEGKQAKLEQMADVNTTAQVLSAQQHLLRIGCFNGAVDGSLGPTTKAAVRRYQSERGRPAGEIDITDAFISELKEQSTRVCPLVCPSGKIANGNLCISPDRPHPVVRHEDESGSSRRGYAKQEEQVAPARRRHEDESGSSRHGYAKQEEQVAPARRRHDAPHYYQGGGGGGPGVSIFGLRLMLPF